MVLHRHLSDMPVLRYSRWASLPLHVVSAILMLMLLRRAGWGHATQAPAVAAPSGQRDLIVGGAWLAGGLLVTLASLMAASGGGRYVIITGAIAYGLIRIVRGLGRPSSS
jgi:hypothetical protein